MPQGARGESGKKDKTRPEGILLRALLLGAYPQKSPKVWSPIFILFGIDTLPKAKLLPVKGVPTPIYRHITKDRLVAEMCVTRIGEADDENINFGLEAQPLVEGRVCTAKTFAPYKAQPLDIIELTNVRLSTTGTYPTSMLFDSMRVLPSDHLGLTGLDRALAIYRANTRFIPKIIELAACKQVRENFPPKTDKATTTTTPVAPVPVTPAPVEEEVAHDEGHGEAPTPAPAVGQRKRDILNSFPIPFLDELVLKEGVKVPPPLLKTLPIYDSVGDVGDTSIDASVPRLPIYLNAASSAGGINIPAQPRLISEANVAQLRSADAPLEVFNIRTFKSYVTDMHGLPTLYPPELAAIMSYHKIPYVVLANVDLNETLNTDLNRSHVGSRGDWPDGILDIKAHAAVWGFERMLLERGIPVPGSLVQERYSAGAATPVTSSVPYIQEDRGALDAYRAEKKFAPVRVPFTNPKLDRTLALDAAPLPLGTDADKLYFALELKELDLDESDRTKLTLAEGEEIVRKNIKRNAGDDKLHGKWIQNVEGKRYGIFLFYAMDKVYAEKLRAMMNKPLDTSALFIAPEEPAAMSPDALPTIHDFYTSYYLGGVNKRPHEDGEVVDEDEPETKRARTEEDPMDTDE
jgi:hypothetical protein